MGGAAGWMDPLDDEERRLRERLGAEEALPFLGHYPLEEWGREELRERLRRQWHLTPGRRIRGLFLRWPALTVAWIAGCAAEHYGTSSGHELYPHLERETALAWTQPVQAQVARWFRWACQDLDLPLPPSGKPVDLYVFQGGVPVSQIRWFADAMERAASRYGLPDPDDTPALRALSEKAAQILPPGLPRLRRLLELDDDGHHARIWTLACQGRIDGADNPFVEALVRHLRERPPSRERITPPRLLWRGAGPSVRVRGRGTWIVEGEGWERRLRPTGEPMEVSLPEEAARGPIRWRAADGSVSSDWPGWADETTVAVFDDVSGRVERWVQSPSTTGALRLEPGIWRLVSRREMCLADGSWASDATFWGDLQELVVQLDDRAQTVTAGDRRLELEPIRKPRLRLSGQSILDEDEHTIWLARGLHVEIDAPEGSLSEQARYALEIELPKGGSSFAEFDLGSTRCVGLSARLQDLEPGLYQLRLRLVREGERRAVARTSALVWIGLDSFDGARFHGRRPRNLDAERSRNIQCDEDGIVIAAPPTDPWSRLVFDDVDGRGRNIELVFPRPGVNAALVSFHDGREHREPLDTDAVVIVRPGDSRILELRCSVPRSRVRVGDRVFSDAFRGTPRFCLPLAAVQLRRSDEIVVEDEHGIDLRIARLRLRLPMGVTRFEPELEPERRAAVLRVGLDQPAEELAIDARCLCSGRQVRFELVADARWRQDPETGARVRLERDLGHPDYGLVVTADLDGWPPGLWLLDLQGRLPERRGWLASTNPRGERFAWLLDRASGNGRESGVDSPTPEATLRLFDALHRELQSRFAPEAWKGGVHRLLGWWRRTAGRLLADRAGPPWRSLLPLAFVPTPSESDAPWVPPCSFWCVFRDFLALPVQHYAILDEMRDDVAEALATAAKIDRLGGLGPAHASGLKIAPEFLGCFGNLSRASRTGEPLRRFRWAAYLEQLERAERGESSPVRLSPAGHRDALHRARERGLKVLREPGHERRKPAAATFAYAAEHWLRIRGLAYLQEMLPDFVAGKPKLYVALDDETTGEDADLVAQIPPAVMALALACRLEPRRPGTLESLFEEARGRGTQAAESAANFVAVLGCELFAFDLLLWECILLEGDR